LILDILSSIIIIIIIIIINFRRTSSTSCDNFVKFELVVSFYLYKYNLIYTQFLPIHLD